MELASPNQESPSTFIDHNNFRRRTQQYQQQRFFSAESTTDFNFDEPFSEIIDENNAFNFKSFFIISFHHLIFYFIIGPFHAILMFLIYGNFNFAKNLGFWGFQSSFYLQSLFFILNFSALFGYYFFLPKNIYFFESITLICATIIRCFFISIKYSLFCEKKIRYVQTKLIPNEEKKKEFLLQWINQEENVIEKELHSIIIRDNIDISVFKIFFTRELTDKQNKIIENKGVDVLDDDSPKDKKKKITYKFNNFKKFNKYDEDSALKEKEGYNGYIISKILIKYSKINNWFIFKASGKITFVFSFIHALIPFLMRIIENKKLFGENSIEIWITIAFFLNNTLLFWLNITFLYAGTLEFIRPIELLCHLSNLISAKKVEKYHRRKEFPTLNFFCKLTFKSWFIMHNIFRGYGRKMLNRIEGQLGVMLLYALIFSKLNYINKIIYIKVIICVLIIFDFSEFLEKAGLVSYGFELLSIFLFIFIMMYNGTIINEHYDIHQTLLRENKDIFSDLLNLEYIYFKKDFKPENEIYVIGRNLLLEGDPHGEEEEEEDKNISAKFKENDLTKSINSNSKNKLLAEEEEIFKEGNIQVIPEERSIIHKNTNYLENVNHDISEIRPIIYEQNKKQSFENNVILKKKQRNKQKERKKYLKDLIFISNDILDHLTFLKTHNPFCVLGIPMNKEIFRSLLASIGTILIASAQRLLKE